MIMISKLENQNEKLKRQEALTEREREREREREEKKCVCVCSRVLISIGLPEPQINILSIAFMAIRAWCYSSSLNALATLCLRRNVAMSIEELYMIFLCAHCCIRKSCLYSLPYQFFIMASL